jgi:alginate O-acetyltransferase complex protein AlgI
MYFNSFVFLLFCFSFFPVYFYLKNKIFRIIFLSFTCLLFYGMFNFYYIPLILFITSVYYFSAIKISGTCNTKHKKIFLLSTIFLNLAVLIFFKYLNFFDSSLNGIFSLFGITINLPLFEFILPAGISFYTFLNISYLIEVHRETIPPEKNFLQYFTFAAFWPTVMSGPILRAKNFLPQFNKNRSFSWEMFYRAFFIVSFGFFKKVFIADNIALYVNRVYDSGIPVTFFNAWSAAYAYALQIYFDFSGYTDIAIGCALLLGFRIPDNFNFPYASASFTEFWKRWHITLSEFLRDYLFLPFSYSALRKIKSQYLAYAFASLATMFIAGLWHGAAWNFVLWGLFHGAALTLERGFKIMRKKRKPLLPKVLKRILFFNFLTISWVLFRNEIPKAMKIFSVMSGFVPEGSVDVLGNNFMLLVIIITISVLLIQYYMSDKNLISIFNKQKYFKIRYAAAVIIIWILVIAAGGKSEPFIYFKF